MYWNLSAGSLPGPYHVKNKIPNQDSFMINDFGGDGFIIAAADGAGSLKKSDVGSRMALEVIEAFVEDNFESFSENVDELLLKAFDKAREVLLKEEDSSELGCTASAFIHLDNYWSTVVVGDSFTILGFEDDYQIINGNQNEDNEFANVTRLMTSEQYDPKILKGVGEVDFAAASTDGMETIAIQNGVPVKGFWSELKRYVYDPNFRMRDLLLHLNNIGKLVDDTTIAVASRLPEL